MFGRLIESSLKKLSHQNEEENPEDQTGYPQTGIDFIRESEMGLEGFSKSKPQELTLSYLCENPKLGFPEEFTGKVSRNSVDKVCQKGKEVLISEDLDQDDVRVERDFLSLSESRGNSSKRDVEEAVEGENSREKKQKLESLNLSLSLPDVSLSLGASTAGDPVVRPKPSWSVQSLAPSTNNTQTTFSNDFSMSRSYSHQFSHNPSCSMTRNSTENYDYSIGRDDRIWCGGEGTNGSVHSRFRPIGGDGGVALNDHFGGGGGGTGGVVSMQGNRNKDSSNSLYRTTSSDNLSFFPSELPAKLLAETLSGDSRRRNSENLRGLESVDEGIARKLSRPERILREIVSESIPDVAQVIQKLPHETLELTKAYLKNLILLPEKEEELAGLQNRLERRSDLTKETLSKAEKDQLNILVAVRMGLASFLSGKVCLPTNELVETFLFMRCRNVNCKSLLPVDDCDCKFCLNKGFCSSCMCPLCMKFDSANNTCSWVGCDVCSHWCHAACGLQKNLIRPGPSLKGPAETTEMQFHCIGCNHHSEMLGFVKDVFLCCAKDWGLETLMKELDCVRKIFKGSEDFKGKELHVKADELFCKLESKAMSPSDACNFITKFFNYFPASGGSSSELMPAQPVHAKDVARNLPAPPTTLPPKYTYKISSSSEQRDLSSNELHRNELKSLLLGDLKIDDQLRFGKLSKKDTFESLESIIRIKEAEARMFQSKADEARREAEGYRRMMQAKSEKMEEDYSQKLAKLCLHETEDKRKKKLEELRTLESSHCDYYNMKLRMQAEIAGLLERMEATKHQLV
ncbi:protein OBERON 3 isoform X2 [Tripterygium wilfordii]|uniref:protein OBERON 3 isoform X2 n=1 Tax=Tripterygium wilfordii TaxID=458696 RepID=UPI0018F84FF5|nr:protein OBERON 3 isoform X2 [Tripterygium wilfordii]